MGLSDFEIVCHGILKARRFKVKPYLDGCISEEYKVATCPICGLKVTRDRKYKQENKKGYGRLKGDKAQAYLNDLEALEMVGRTNQIEIFENDYKIAQGSKGAMGFVFGVNTLTGQYAEDFNGTRTLVKSYNTNPIKGSFRKEHLETVLAG